MIIYNLVVKQKVDKQTIKEWADTPSDLGFTALHFATF